MKTKAAILTVLMVTLALFHAFSAVGEEARAEEEMIVLESLLDQYIAKCDAKQEMKASNLENVRRAAAVAMLKGAFVKTYRQELINGMIEDGVEPKVHKVQLYLNDRFYRLVRTDKPTM